MTDFDGAALDWPAHLETCLSSTFYCALATAGPTGAWVNPVYFSYSNDYSLLFISLMSSRHMDNIARDPEAAVAIYSTDQPPGQHVVAIQMKGRAES